MRCASSDTGAGRIGLPLDGWDLAVVDSVGQQVAEGETGELIIGGIGLARYLDSAKDARSSPRCQRWMDRAYRSGDSSRYEHDGLIFLGRADDQIKLGGRRIELGEIDSALLALPGVTGAAAAVRSTKSGNRLLVGYIATRDGFDAAAATERLRAKMPAALVPRLAQVETLPTRTSGKIDRDALPWPMAVLGGRPNKRMDGTQASIQELWTDILGVEAAVRAGRLLRPRRRQSDSCPAGLASTPPSPRDHRGRRLRGADSWRARRGHG